MISWALSYTRRNAAPSVTQVVFASFSPTQFSFSCPAAHSLNSKCICPHGRAGLKKEMCSGALLARCYFEELKIDCAIDQLKPSLKSMAQYFFCYLKSALVENGPMGTCSLCLLHTGTHSSTQTCQILKIKGLQCKIILLCRLHKY